LHSSANILPADQLLQEIETRAVQSQQQLNITKAQITAKQRETRLLELTSKEIGSLPKETNVYEGVGKM
jgi:prefoldin subunit 1